MDFAAAVRKAPGSAPEGSPVTAPRKESPKPRPAKQAAASSSSSSTVHEDVNGSQVDSAAEKLKAESVLVGFEVFVPEPEKDSLSTSTEKEEEDEDAVREEADAADAAEAEEAQENAASPDAPKAKNGQDRFFAPSQLGRRPRSVELGSILLKKADDRAFEVRGGLRFSNKADANAKNQAPQAIAELNLDTVNQSYRYVQSLIDLLKGQSPSHIAAGHNSFVQLSRVGDFVKVTRTYKDEGDRKVEHVFKFESFAIQVREQAKQYAKAAAAVYQTVSRGKEQDKRAKAVQDKLMITQFENAANTLKDLFSTTTVLPRLADKFKKQQENKNKSKKMNEADIREFKKQITDRVGRAFMEKDPASMIPSEEDDIIAPTPAPAPVEEKKPAPVAEKKKDAAAANKQQPQQQKNAQGSSSSTTDAAAAPAPRREKQNQGPAGLKFSSNPYDIGNFNQQDLAKIEDTETERQLAQAESAKKPPVKAKKPAKKQEQPKPKAEQKPAQQPAAAAAPVAAAAEKKSPQPAQKAQEQPKKKEKQPEQPKKAVEQPKKVVEPEQPKPKAEQPKKEKKPQLSAEERAKAKISHEQGEKETGKKVAQKLKAKQPAAKDSQDLITYAGVAGGVLLVLFLLFQYGLPMLQSSN